MGLLAPPRDRAVRKLVAGAALIGATVLLALFTVAANTPPPNAPWPPGSPNSMRLRLARDPLDPAAERDLGLALGLSGSSTDAERLMTFAAGRSQRDNPTEDWLLVRRLSEGRYDEAFAAADALLRRDIDDRKRERLSTLLVAAAHYDASRPALVARLAPSPWWREAYMRDLAAHADPVDARFVFAGLSRTTHPVTDLELAPFLDGLVARRDYRAAERDWRTFSRPRRDPHLVNDLAAPPPFGWSETIGEGASSGVEAGALRIDYDGFGHPVLPRRLLALTPGPYRVSWRERTDGDPRTIVRVACADTATVLSTASISDGPPGIKHLEFTVPPSACEGQWLEIATIPGERRSAVSGTFSDWALSAPRFR